MDNVIPLDSALSKPQLVQVMHRAHKRLLGMHQIAKALSDSDLEFAQESFEVFADNLDKIAADMFVALYGDPMEVANG